MTRIEKRDRNAPIAWGLVAVVRRDLETIIKTHRVEANWLHEPLEGGWLREVELALQTGGLAYLGERRNYPGEFTIYLMLHRDMFFFKEDFEEVIAFLALSAAEITVLTGQVRWSKKKRAPQQ